MLWLLFYNEGKRAGGSQAGECPPMKKHKPMVASTESEILEGKIVKLPVQKLAILTPIRADTVFYFGRQGIAGLFKELIDPKEGKNTFNVSLIGHPGAGKSNLVWAVAHHLVTQNKETVLWASRRDGGAEWELRLFEHKDNSAFVYEFENAPEKLGEILMDDLLKDLSVLIIDAPTVSKSQTPPSYDGLAAFQWAGTKKRKGARRVIHTSSLRAFSTDERTLTENCLENRTMRPWTRCDFVKAMHNEELKAQVCKTLALSSTDLTPEDLVDMKLFYSGINARWFFNLTIEQIKESSQAILDRMSHESISAGISHERAVNSAYISFWEDDRQIRLYTSRYLALLLGRSKNHSTTFFELFPLMKGRLGNGAPGEIFEADFLVNLEHCHGIAASTRALMGKQAQQVDVRLGVDMSNEKAVYWPTGKVSVLPKQMGDKLAAQPMSFRADQVTNRVPQWFVPDDKHQPFLDFFVLFPCQDGSWTLKVIQNRVSTTHSTDLKQLERVLMGVENAGFSLKFNVVVAFVIEKSSQTDVGSKIDGKIVKVQCSTGRVKRGDGTTKAFKIKVLRVLFTRTGAAP